MPPPVDAPVNNSMSYIIHNSRSFAGEHFLVETGPCVELSSDEVSLYQLVAIIIFNIIGVSAPGDASYFYHGELKHYLTKVFMVLPEYFLRKILEKALDDCDCVITWGEMRTIKYVFLICDNKMYDIGIQFDLHRFLASIGCDLSRPYYLLPRYDITLEIDDHVIF